MTDEMIEEDAGTIRMLHFQKVDTKIIHKALQSSGRRLGDRGKQKVSGGRRRLRMETRRSILYLRAAWRYGVRIPAASPGRCPRLVKVVCHVVMSANFGVAWP